LGCGNRYIKGYKNIDLRKTKTTDLVLDIKKLPYFSNSVERIETYHVIEHLNRHDLIKALKEWHRVLRTGGQLIIEFPDFDKIVKKYLEGETKMLDGIFGLQRFEGDYHLFGYNFPRLKKVLEEIGFNNVKEKKAVDYHIKEWPCLRLECIKGENSGTHII
jgi:predicted SAM-dependent methyltransferase